LRSIDAVFEVGLR